MRKSDRCLTMYCYKFAPESFRAWGVIGGSHENRNVFEYKEIPLSHDEKFRCGYPMVCGDKKAAMSELKKIIRRREKKTKLKLDETYKIFFVRKDDRRKRVYDKISAHYSFGEAQSVLNGVSRTKKWMAYKNGRGFAE